MSGRSEAEQYRASIEEIGRRLISHLLRPLYDYLSEYPDERNHLNPAFPYPQELRVGMLADALALEFIGPERADEATFPTRLFRQDTRSVLDFLGIDISHLRVANPVRIGPVIANLNCYLGNSIDRLDELHYSYEYSTELSMFGGLPELEPPEGGNLIVSNMTIFWTDLDDRLRVRHVDFLDLHANIRVDHRTEYCFHTEKSLKSLKHVIIGTPVPQFDIGLHRDLNRFVELMHENGTTEPALTSYLAEHPALIGLAFGYRELHPQLRLEWQDRTGEPDLQPDFMPERPDTFSDILEFKLPLLKSFPTVGREQRPRPAVAIADALGQLEKYEEYSSQKMNQDWVEATYGVKLRAPRRILVIGMRDTFPAEDRQRWQRYRETTIITYDDFLDLARYQLYRVK